MFNDWSFWFSIVTAVVAIIALLQTHKQISLSNKQYLFNERLENYLVAMGFIELYKKNYESFETQNLTPLFSIGIDFADFTNNTYLEKISYAIKTPLENPGHKEFLIKLEEIKLIANKIKFLFSGEEGELLGEFVLRYKEFLFAMYQYQIVLDKIEELANNNGNTLEKAQEAVGEERRNELNAVFEKLKLAFELLEAEKVDKKIKRQIRIK